jgi:transketolase
MNLTQKSINYIQTISAEMVMRAKSGHTGVALGAATILFALFKDHLRYDVAAEHINRDRFVLSAGHASALYYTLLYAFGFDVTMEDLENFRQIGAVTTGHPEFGTIKGVETTTGPLGQGVANAVGLAIASNHYAKLFNVQKFQIFDNKVYCFVGDGDLMEGIAQESLSLAGSLKLKNLIFLYDYNKCTIDGKLSKSNTEDVGKKYASMGFRVIYCSDGHDYNMVTKAIEKAKKEKSKPVMVIFRTKIGHQSRRQDDPSIHGTPLTDDEFAELKEKLGITTTMFIPSAVLKYCRQSTQKNNERIEEWKKNLILYQTTHPELHKMFLSHASEPKFARDKLYKLFCGVEKISGRDANKKVFNEIASKITNMIGGSADLAASTKVYIEKGKDMSVEDYAGRNIFFGIREHAMAGICNGIALFANTRTFNSTFLVFSQYMLPSIRLSAMMNLPVWYFFTHDSIYVGEDGPTHQPIEQLGQLRLIPNLTVFRPADPIELVDCYGVALQSKNPCCFVLSRQDLPVVAVGKEGQAQKGAYVVSPASTQKPKLAFIASGSEVAMCLEAQKILEKEGISCEVISVPCTNLLEAQRNQTKTALLNNAEIVVAVEASNDNYWYRHTPHVFGINTYGASGKSADVAKHLGFTVRKLVAYAKSLVKNKKM